MARRQSGVLDLFGGLALGLSQSMQANKDAALKQEFLKAQMDEAKAKAKHYEAKVKADLMKEQMMANPGKFINQIASQFGYQGEGAMPQEGLPATPPQMPMQAPAPQQGAPAAPMAPMSGGGGGQFGDLINKYAQMYGVSPQLVERVMEIESNFNPQAVNKKSGAQGLMQLMPGTAAGLGVTNPFDPEQNIRGGTQYLAEQIKKFGSIPLGLAAYNAGPGAVEKYGGIPPYPETQKYVTDVTQQIAQAQTDQQMQAQQALPKALAQVPTNEKGVLDFSDLPQPVRMAIDMWGKMALDMDFNLTKSNIQVRGNTKDGYIITSGTRIVRRIPGEGSVALRETPQGVMAVREPTAGELKQTGPQTVAPLPFKYGTIPGTDSEGRPQVTIIDENRPGTAVSAGAGLGKNPPSQPANTITTGPSPREKAPVMPDKIREEITEIGTAIKHIGILRNTVKPEYLGMWAKYAKGAMDEYGGSLGLGSPERYTFRQNYEELIGQKLQARGGTAQTESEKKTIRATLPKLTQSTDVFKAGLDAAELLLQIEAYDKSLTYATSDKNLQEKSRAELWNKYNALKEKLKPYAEGGKAQSQSDAGWIVKKGSDGRMYKVNPNTREYIPVQ